jgi:hypothetical protein
VPPAPQAQLSELGRNLVLKGGVGRLHKTRCGYPFSRSRIWTRAARLRAMGAHLASDASWAGVLSSVAALVVPNYFPRKI